eukprot:682362-Amphidinium_carterae.3
MTTQTKDDFEYVSLPIQILNHRLHLACPLGVSPSELFCTGSPLATSRAASRLHRGACRKEAVFVRIALGAPLRSSIAGVVFIG